MSEKPKLAMYWSASCGGCEISVLNIHEHILTVDEVFDIAFFPCIADFKVHHVEEYPDDYIDVCLWNGAEVHLGYRSVKISCFRKRLKN